MFMIIYTFQVHYVCMGVCVCKIKKTKLETIHLEMFPFCF